MKLYLASLGIPHPDPLIQLIGKSEGIRAASIRDAWDPYPDERKREWTDKAEASFARIRAEVEIVSLQEYDGNPDSLQEKLDGFDLVWLHGGNSFYLNYRAQRCGLPRVLRELLSKGLVYGGESAGACVAGPDLHGIEFADDPAEAPEPIYEALGLTDFAVIPHWGNEKYRAVLEKCKEESERYGRKVITLSDTQAIVVRDGVRTIMS